MSEILGNVMEILYKRGYVEYHSSLYANVLKEYNLEVPGLRPAWALTFDRGEPFAPVSLCRFILIHISCFKQRSGLPSFQLLAVLEI